MKQRLRRILGLFLVMVMTVTLFTACGTKSNKEDDKKAGETTGQETKSESSSKAEKSDEPVVIDILSGTITEDVEGKLELAMAEAYMELHPNVTINYIGTPSNELTKKMTAYVTNDDLPDAFTLMPDFFPKAVELGILVV